MLIYSSYLKSSVDVGVTAIPDANNPEKVAMNVISHDSLRKIFLEEISLHNIKCKYEPIMVNGKHNAVLCTISNDHREVMEVGESLPGTLNNQVARNYPILIAYQRAFDRAFIAFLGFDGKYLSEVEVSDDYDPTATLSSSIPTMKDDSELVDYEEKKEEPVVYDESPEDEMDQDPILAEELEDDGPEFEDAFEDTIAGEVVVDETAEEEPVAEDTTNIDEEPVMNVPTSPSEPALPEMLAGKSWNGKIYGKPGGQSIFLDRVRTNLTQEDVDMLQKYLQDKEAYDKWKKENS